MWSIGGVAAARVPRVAVAARIFTSGVKIGKSKDGPQHKQARDAEDEGGVTDCNWGSIGADKEPALRVAICYRVLVQRLRREAHGEGSKAGHQGENYQRAVHSEG